MFAIPGIVVSEILDERRRSSVARARRGGRSVLVRAPTGAYPTSAELARMRYGAELAKGLDVDGVLAVEAIEPYAGGLAIFLEDAGGTTLRNVLRERRLSPSEAVRVALDLAKTLGLLHQRRVIHKSVEPGSIWTDPATGRVKLTNFDIASRLAHETLTATGTNWLDGAAAYVSPEQTGRMNRSIDYRTDMYSLGVTLYEMLTGEPPFADADPMAVVHAHLAVEPVPPHVRDSSVPPSVSAVVMKLLAKDAEDRYQSAYGLVKDLEECLDRISGAGVPGDFVAGAHDASASFQLPQKLYGRDAERAKLIEAFGRASGGATELVLVYGYSGVGKSALVNEIQRPIVEKRGYFAAGKHDQLRSVPYGAFIQALRELVRQILGESEERLAAWRAELSATLGSNAQVIVDVVPELGLMLGPQPVVGSLGPSESQNRFNFTFRAFLGALARPEHPLAIFLDDLQWADSGSLALLQLILKDPGSRNLLVIGSYRDNEVHGAHPLMLALAEIRKGPAKVSEIAVRPLEPSHIEELVSDAFGGEAWALAEIISSKTEGNPFFINQFLEALHARELLVFDPTTGRWRWDLVRIREASITDNVASLMAAKLGRLPEREQRLLRLAACIGNHFDQKTLAIVAEQPSREISGALLDAVDEGLIMPVGDAYKYIDPGETLPPDVGPVEYAFVHDRVQEAAYALIPEGERKAVHLRVGRLMLASTPASQREARIFDIVDHLDRCVDLLTTADEKRELAELNLAAGARAKASSAYAAALGYTGAGIDLLGEDAWEKCYDLAFALYSQRAECQYVLARAAEAEATTDVLLARARSRADKAAVHRQRQSIYGSLGRIAPTLQEVRASLKLYDVEIPDDDGIKGAVMAEMGALAGLLAGRSIESLASLPASEDADDRMRAQLMSKAIDYAYVVPDWFALLSVLLVKQALQRGNTPGSARGYLSYGMVVGSGLGDWVTGHELGKVAVKVTEELDDLAERSTVIFFFAFFVNPWRKHVRTSVPLLERSLTGCLESGALLYLATSCVQSVFVGYFSGDELSSIAEKARKFIDLQTRLGQHQWCYVLAVYLRAARLLGGGEIPEADRPWIDEAAIEQYAGFIPATLNIHHINALAVAYLLEDPAAARYAEQARAGVATNFGNIIVPVFHFYDALLAASQPLDDARRATIEDGIAKMKGWASVCPENFHHLELLMSAELSRVTGRDDEATSLYDRAIDEATEQGFLQNQAIASELAGKFHLAKGRRRVARSYLADARHAYAQWGAAAKVAKLDAAYRDLLARAGGVSIGAEASIDLTAVMRASQAISSEIVLADLLRSLMRTLLATAGAQRGFLLLHGDEAVVEAERAGEAGERVEIHKAEGDLGDRLAIAAVRYVERTGETLVVGDAVSSSQLQADPYVASRRPKSVLCAPILRQKKLLGILYLENNLVADAFTDDRRRVLELLAGQAAISLENARLYDTLDARVKEQTRELRERNADLSVALQRLKETQRQLVMQEKLASLGTLTSGIAHEIKNPLNFITNFADLSSSLTDELREEIGKQAPRLGEDTASYLGDTLGELRQNVDKIVEHAKRADNIVRSMDEHARHGGGERTQVDVVSIADEYAGLVHKGFCARDPSFVATVAVESDPALPRLEAVAQDIARVLLNLLNNAFYAVAAKRRRLGASFTPAVGVTLRERGAAIEIRVRDNGDGVPPAIRDKIWTPFFTTKPTGDGTGLGLSIAHEIVTQGYGGTLGVEDVAGEGADFVITLPLGRA